MKINWEAKICGLLIERGPMTADVLASALHEQDGLTLERYTLQRLITGGDLAERPDGTLYPTRRGALAVAGATPAAPHALMARWQAGL